jgi:2-methylcitrate dehydratase PrpD
MIAKKSPSLTECFSAFSNQFSVADAPQEVVEYARLLVLDLVGCALGGVGTPEQIAACTACLKLDGGAGGVGLWGTGKTASPRTAAMYNGIIAHVLELDDFLGIDHTGAVVLPALFAVMEHENDYDEPRFLEAMILGYEIGRRMLDAGGGYSKHNSTGWHTTGTLGAYSAAVAVCKYLRMTVSETVYAIGLSGSVAGGTWAFNADGAMSKRFHPGIAAQNGITAAYMAREGFTGPKYVLEAEWGGYFAQYASNHDCDLNVLFAGLGDDLRLAWTGIKPYACCRGCHSAIDVMHQMRRDNHVTSGEVQKVLVSCSASQHRQLGSICLSSISEAQLSMPYAIALALRFDTIGTDRFTASAISDTATLVLSQKVEFSVQSDWTLGKEPEFQVTLLNGNQFNGYVAAAKGDRSNPMPKEQVVKKFQQLVEDRISREDEQALIGFGLSNTDRINLKALSEILGAARAYG